ncbi:MAG: peptidyl-prolyl cis-trans isomerase [Candidatus Aminicenantes bacterium]|nr:peptidyl-prolyl cis-trans isomerase [Candidatus Aminicenantes bacterium]
MSEVIDTGSAAVILKVTEKMPEITRSLAEVKPMIQVNLKESKARSKASDRIEKLAKIAANTKNLEEAAKREGLKVEDTGLLKNGDPIPQVDSSGSISQALFELKKEKEFTSPIFTYEGVALAQLIKIIPEHPATYEEVKNEVREDLLKEKKKQLAKEKLLALKTSQVKSLEDLAKANSLEYKSVETHKRGQYLSLIEDNEKVDELIFSLPLNQISEPVDIGNGYVVIRVLDRKEVSRDDFEKVKNDEMAQALSQAQEMFLYSYLQKVREDKKVKINVDLFNRLTEDILGRIGE